MGFDINSTFLLKPLGKRLLGLPSRRQKDNIIVDLHEVVILGGE